MNAPIALFFAAALQATNQIALLPIPKALTDPKPIYFAATATDTNGVESDFSNEAVINHFNGSNLVKTVTLEWDASPSPDITNYTIHWGGASGTYSRSIYAGTNLVWTVDLLVPVHSNRVITIWTENATNIRYAARPCYPWLLAYKTNLCFTNPPAPALYYEPMARSSNQPARIFIRETFQ
jgi:hypothetical protein